MFEFSSIGISGRLEGRTEYGVRVVLEFLPRGEKSYDLSLTFEGREPLRFNLLRNDIEFLGNKIQLKGPYLRIVVDRPAAKKFRAFVEKS